jgi:hypothetical protein
LGLLKQRQGRKNQVKKSGYSSNYIHLALRLSINSSVANLCSVNFSVLAHSG